MTSNQIAAASNAIELKKLEETQRHNIETENIERDRNRIDEAYKTQSNDIERQKNALNEELGKLNIEWQSANESRKREIEERKTSIDQELAMLENYKAQVDEEYKRGLVTTKFLEVGEQERSNKEREAIQSKANAIKEREVDLTERSEMGQTPKSRAQIVQAAGSVKGPFGLGSLGIFYGTESVLAGAEMIQQHNKESKPKIGEKNTRDSSAQAHIKTNNNWAQQKNQAFWTPARDR
jgi:hypothetical protein